MLNNNKFAFQIKSGTGYLMKYREGGPLMTSNPKEATTFDNLCIIESLLDKLENSGFGCVLVPVRL